MTVKKPPALAGSAQARYYDKQIGDIATQVGQLHFEKTKPQSKMSSFKAYIIFIAGSIFGIWFTNVNNPPPVVIYRSLPPVKEPENIVCLPRITSRD